MTLQIPDQLELFKTYLNEYLSTNYCVICHCTSNVSSYLCRLPGDDFSSFQLLCDICKKHPLLILR